MTINNSTELHETIVINIINKVKQRYLFDDMGSHYFLEDTGWSVAHAQAVFAGLCIARHVFNAGQLMEITDGVDCFAEAYYQFGLECLEDLSWDAIIEDTVSDAMRYACAEPWNAYFDLLTGLDKENALNLTEELAQKVVNYLYDGYRVEEAV
jgi:hypothetical protein